MTQPHASSIVRRRQKTVSVANALGQLRHAGRRSLKSAAGGAVAGAGLTVATELAAGTVRVANCPAGQQGNCGAAAVAAESAALITVAAVAGAAVGAVAKAAALAGVTVSAPV